MSIKAFFRWLTQYGVILIDPGEKVLQHTVISPLPQVLTEEETEAVLEVATKHLARQPDARYFTLVALLLETGIKKSECLALSPNHIDRKRRKVHTCSCDMPAHSTVIRNARLPISEDWLEAYDEYKEQYQPGTEYSPGHSVGWNICWKTWGKKLGLTKHLSFEMCRWTCALHDLQIGMEANKVRQKMGLSKIQWREVRLKLQKLAGREFSET